MQTREWSPEASPEAVRFFEGLPQQLDIAIQAADIREGKHRNCEECPTALAVIRATGEWKQTFAPHVSVGGITVQLGYDHIEPGMRVSVCYMLTPELSRWIQAFDQNQRVGPLTVTLNKADYHRQDLEEAA